MSSDEIATLRTELDAEMKLHLKAAAERDELRAENERLRADAERLDWLEADATHIPIAAKRWALAWNDDSIDLRAAIDAAREGE